MSDTIINFVPPGMIRCYVTGKLRKDTPEEHVRQRWARSLVEEYGYPLTDLGIEITIHMGRSRKRADLVVFRHECAHTQGEALIIIEAKRSDLKPSDGKHGEGQLRSYMAASPVCRFGLWVGEERRAFERNVSSGEIARIGDIPRFGNHEPVVPSRDGLVPVHELRSTFRRCHNYIWVNAGLSKPKAFRELLKLIFCKTFDEQEGSSALQFVVQPAERTTESGQRRLMEERLHPLFERVRRRYPYIFAEDEKIELEAREAAYVVHELQHISLLETSADVKGAAYEELVGENLRGDRGEYFTPRNVCDMAVRMVMQLYDESVLTSLTVMDCCCGTGGFLVSWLNNLYEVVLEQERRRRKSRSQEQRISRAKERVKDACNNHMFGLDIDLDLVRTCQMNLVLHGDGSSNVYRCDSVRSPGEWSAETRNAVEHGKADVVFTNPPFGGKAYIDDAHILGQYTLASWESRTTRSLMAAEKLFVEAALNFVRPGGHLAIVLPDGILNNPGLKYIRTWLLRRSRLIASIDLPKTTFGGSGGVNNPSVLIVRKFDSQEQTQISHGIPVTGYQVFMAAPETSGIKNTRKNTKSMPLYLRNPDGTERLDQDGNKLVDDQISEVAQAFGKWLQGR